MEKKKKKMINRKNNNLKNIKKFISNNKNLLVVVGLLVLDVALIIWVARNNVANYVNINGKDVFVGNVKNLLLGRNYITLVITFFIYIYGFFINKILLKNKNKRIFWILLFIAILVINIGLFFIFTDRVY